MKDSNYGGWLPLKFEQILILAVGLGTFYFVPPIREILGESSLNVYFNVFYVLGGGFLFLTCALERRIHFGVFILIFCFGSVAVLSNLSGGQNAFNHLVTGVNVIMPLLFIGISLNFEVMKPVIRGFIKVMSLMSIIMICIGIPDMLSGGIIQQYLIGHVFSADLATLAQKNSATGIYRFFFLGHPLSLAWNFLLFFTLNVLNNKYNQAILPTPVAALITLAGLIICNSRSALLIGVFMILLLNGDYKRRWFYAAAVILLAVTIVFVPVVKDNVAQRFATEMQKESISGGRNEAALMVFDGSVEPPAMIIGNGIGYSREVTQKMGGFINSFEYPVIMFAYDYSVAGMAMLYSIILVIPVLLFMKEKRWLEMGLFLLLTLYMNGMNDISNGNDGLAQFCLAIVFLIYIGRKENRTEVEGAGYETDSVC